MSISSFFIGFLVGSIALYLAVKYKQKKIIKSVRERTVREQLNTVLNADENDSFDNDNI